MDGSVAKSQILGWKYDRCGEPIRFKNGSTSMQQNDAEQIETIALNSYWNGTNIDTLIIYKTMQKLVAKKIMNIIKNIVFLICRIV